MRRFSFPVYLLMAVLLLIPVIIQAQTHIEINTPMTPTSWALMERELLRAGAEGCEVFADHFLDERGYLECREHWGGNDGPESQNEVRKRGGGVGHKGTRWPRSLRP